MHDFLASKATVKTEMNSETDSAPYVLQESYRGFGRKGMLSTFLNFLMFSLDDLVFFMFFMMLSG